MTETERPDELQLSPEKCARRAAEAVLRQQFGGEGLVGFGGRSTVFPSADGRAVLKVYTQHRRADRLQRELAGLDAAASLADVRVPAVLGYDAEPIQWIGMTRLAGTSATESRWADDDTTERIGRLAAKLHSLPTRLVAGRLPSYRRAWREIPTEHTEEHRAGTLLEAALSRTPGTGLAACGSGFVHGDFSSRNILIVEGEGTPGLIDFEGCGIGCGYEDLATLVTKDALLGDRTQSALLMGYTDELDAQGGCESLDDFHLYVHIAQYARWVLQWAPTIDAPFCAEILGLVPDILKRLREPGP